MKESSLILGILIALMVPDSFAQEARVERFTKTIYGEVYSGDIYFNETFFVNQQNAPVLISGATTRHIPRKVTGIAKILYRSVGDLPDPYVSIGKEDVHIGNLTEEQLEITVDADGEDVVAVKFGVVVYDAFKDYLGGLTAITMDSPTAGMKWDYRPAYLFKFERYGVVGIYVRQARLTDGTIWNFDEGFVASEMSKKFGKITAEQIREPRGD